MDVHSEAVIDQKLVSSAGIVDASEAAASAGEGFAADVISGLSARHKHLPPKYFYDAAGSRLFGEICRIDEYYVTRAETALLGNVAAEIATGIPGGAALVEFGSGESAKTRLLLDAAPQLSIYVPIDISAAALCDASARLARDYPQLSIPQGRAPAHRELAQVQRRYVYRVGRRGGLVCAQNLDQRRAAGRLVSPRVCCERKLMMTFRGLMVMNLRPTAPSEIPS